MLYSIACRLLAQVVCHESETDNFAAAVWTYPAHCLFVDLDESWQREEWTVLIAINVGSAYDVGKDHGVRQGAVNKAECDWRVAWMVQCALSLDEDPIVGPGEIKHHLFDHPCHKVTNDAVHR